MLLKTKGHSHYICQSQLKIHCKPN